MNFSHAKVLVRVNRRRYGFFSFSQHFGQNHPDGLISRRRRNCEYQIVCFVVSPQGSMKMPEQRDTFMLFRDSASAIRVSLFEPPANGVPPVTVTMIPSTTSRDVQTALEFGALAAVNVLQSYGHIKFKIPVYAAVATEENTAIIGRSGGLAFAVGIACALSGLSNVAVAATGVVDSCGKVSRIDDITAKLRVAASCMRNTRGWIFYPQENEHEIDEGLLDSLDSAGLKPKAVNSVAQTIGYIFNQRQDSITIPSPVSMKKNIPRPIALSLLLIGTTVLFHDTDIQKVPRFVQNMISNNGTNHESMVALKANGYNADVAHMSLKRMSPLNTKFQIFWAPFLYETSALGFAESIENQTHIPIHVLKRNNRYLVAFKYADATERSHLIDEIESTMQIKLFERTNLTI